MLETATVCYKMSKNLYLELIVEESSGFWITNLRLDNRRLTFTFSY